MAGGGAGSRWATSGRCCRGCWRRGCRWRSGSTCRWACRGNSPPGGRKPGFAAFLRGLADSPDFFRVSAGLETVSPARPFYPARGIAGMTRAAHAAALGLSGPMGLSRWCDRATAERPAGAPLFWTLGANQSGKAAITAWRDWIVPALNTPLGAAGAPIRLWPFEGGLHALLAPGVAVLAEVYPAEALRHCGLKLAGSKRARGAAPGPGAGAAGGDGGARGAARPGPGRRRSRPASAPMRPARTASTASSACSG